MRNETMTPGRYELHQETAEQILERYSRHVNHRFTSVIKLIGFNRVFVKAREAWLWDQAGRRYLDFLGDTVFSMSAVITHE